MLEREVFLECLSMGEAVSPIMARSLAPAICSLQEREKGLSSERCLGVTVVLIGFTDVTGAVAFTDGIN